MNIKKVNKIFNKALKNVNKQKTSKNLSKQGKTELAYSLTQLSLTYKD